MPNPQVIEQAYACLDGGDAAQAMRLLDAALAATPADADLLFARGNVRRESGDGSGAMEDFQAVLAARPAHALAHNNLGAIQQERGELAPAQASFEHALRHDPQCVDAAYNLGSVLAAQGQAGEAVAWLERATAWRPGFAAAWLLLGQVLGRLARMEQAMAAMRQAIAADPGRGGAYNDLGLFLLEMNRIEEAVSAHEQAVACAPQDDDYKTNLGLALMQTGDFARAWENYAHRWREEGRLRPAYRYDPALEWQGGMLTGKRLRVWWEQGLGDTLCFSRFVPLVAARFGPAAVSFEVQPGFKRLLAHSLPGVEVLEQGEAGGGYDLHLPILNLPQRYGISAANLPAQTPYLAPSAATLAHWQSRLAGLPAPRVGVVWASGLWPGGAGPRHRLRSVDPDSFARVLSVSGVSFVNLQKGAGAEDTARWSARPGFFDWTGELADWNDTAALIAGLDLVITVDTSVAHLAAALGKPTWVMLRCEGGNLWAAREERSFWYPRMRVFRQRDYGDWSGVTDRVAAALRDYAASGGRA